MSLRLFLQPWFKLFNQLTHAFLSPSLYYFLCPKLLFHPSFSQGEDGLPVQGCWNKVK